LPRLSIPCGIEADELALYRAALYRAGEFAEVVVRQRTRASRRRAETALLEGSTDIVARRPEQVASDYKRLDAASYDNAAAEFGSLTERFNGPLAARIVDLAQLHPTDHVLDVGTGTGLVALRAGALAPSGRVVAIDHSSGMLQQASAKAHGAGLCDVVMFRQMDAERLEFPDRSFDVVVSLYSLFHFPDPVAAVREVHRVLRSAGRVVIGVGSGPILFSSDGVVQGARGALRLIAAARGRLLIAPQFLLGLMREHGMEPDEEHRPKGSRMRIAQMLHQAGFKRVYRCWQGHCEELNPDEFWNLQVTYTSEARIRLQQAAPAELAALKNDFIERCRHLQANRGKLIYPHAAMFYAGTRA
jgi:ubiquinone/menaquinone biosynthesis C-methylase UbiE